MSFENCEECGWPEPCDCEECKPVPNPTPKAGWHCTVCEWKDERASMAQASQYHFEWNKKQGFYCPGNLIAEH